VGQEQQGPYLPYARPLLELQTAQGLPLEAARQVNWLKISEAGWVGRR
jgi:hypothetical protein